MNLLKSMKTNLLTVKLLLISNFLLFIMVMVLLFMHYNIPSRILKALNYNQETKKSICQIDTTQTEKIEKTYPLSYFDFHYKNETQNPKIIMLGNSIIRRANWEELLGRKDVINRGISGDNLSGMCDRLKYLKDKNAKIWFIEGGINDLPGNNTNDLFEHYKTIVEFIKSENAIPVINLVFYLSPKAGEKFPTRSNYNSINDSICKLNIMLTNYASKNKIDYINLNTTIASKERVLLDKYTTDGVHINDLGYKLWVIEINKILKKHNL